MAIELQYGAAIEAATASPAIRFLNSKWKILHAAGRLNLQALTEGSYDIPSKSVYMVTVDDDFLYMHMGAHVREVVAQDFTGRLLSSVDDPVARDLLETYRAVLQFHAPMYTRFTSPLTDSVLLWERIILPVPVGKSGTILVSYSEIMSYHLEVYQYVFRNSPVPMMVVYPIFTPENVIDDGWVMLANDVARNIFDVPDRFGNLRMRELRAFQRPDFWSELAKRYEVADPDAHLSAAVLGEDYGAMLIRLKHIAILRFPPKALRAPVFV